MDALAARGINLDLSIATAVNRPPPLTVAPAPRPLVPVAEPEIDKDRPGLPVLEAFLQQYFSARRPFDKLHAVLILHFLTDLPPLLQRIQDLGLEPGRTWLVRKPYQYRFADEIRRELKHRAYNIEECTAAEGAEEPARRVLTNMRSSLGPEDKFLVIEDGGYITPLLHTDEFAGLREKCVGVVEQTTKGIRAIREIKDLRVPVVAVAESRLKLSLEAGEVGDALHYVLETYFRTVLQMPLRVPTLVIGYGAVGRNLTSALMGRGAQVSVYDSDFAKRAEAHSSRPSFPVLEKLDDLRAFQLIVGTTGKTSIDIDALMKTAPGVILASGSSDRLEFDLPALRERVLRPLDQNITLEGLVTRYRLSSEHAIDVVCDGYPINFILGDGIAKRVIDPILTELVVGAGRLAENEYPVPGIHGLPDDVEKDLWDLYSKLNPY